MSSRQNEFGQPIGPAVTGWKPRALPPRTPMIGHYCRVEPIDVERDAAPLFAAFSAAADGSDWTYLPVGPFGDAAAYREHLARIATSADPLHLCEASPARRGVKSVIDSPSAA